MDDPHDQLRLAIDPNRMRATLVIPAGLDGARLTKMGVEMLFLSMELARPCLRPDVADEALALYAKTCQETRVVVAEGVEPRHAEDGRIDLEPEIAEQMRVTGSRELRPVVKPGQRIGTIIPPTIGADGVDVLGRVLSAKQGRDAAPLVDSSIAINGPVIIAQAAGLLKVADRLIRVHSSADIDSITPEGVEFPASLKVRQGVADGAIVRVGGDLEVGGLVDAATLEVGDNAKLLRGMAARSVGRLTIGKSLTAHYLSNVEGTVGGDLQIDKEIVSSSLSVCGRCVGTRATLIGGTLIVGRACEFDEIGCDAWTATELALGRLAQNNAHLTQAMSLLILATTYAKQSKEELDTMQKAAPRPTHEQAEAVTELMFRTDGDRARIAKLTGAIRSLCDAHRRGTHAKLAVMGRLHAGVRLFLGKYEVTVRKTMRGPLEVGLDEADYPLVTDVSTGSVIREGASFRVSPSMKFVDVSEAEVAIAQQLKAA